MKPLRILLVDDHVLFRKGIASLISARQDMTVIGEAGNGLEAVKIARQTAPDLILMDVNMPEQDGLETVKIIKRKMPEIHVVMLTVSDSDEDLFEALKNGAEGYLLKNLEPHELYEMLNGIRHGEAPISGAVATKILREFREPGAEEPPETVDDLTPREIQVLEQIVTGATNKEIADTLDITENTVKIHLRNILGKLHVKNRIQAAVQAVREGLIDGDPVDEPGE